MGLTADHFRDHASSGESVDDTSHETPAVTETAPANQPPAGSLPPPVSATRSTAMDPPIRTVPIPTPSQLKPPGSPPWAVFWWLRRKWEGELRLYNDAVARMGKAIESRRTCLQQLVRQRPIVITTVSPKGGAGKTASSTCLAAVIGEATQYPVLVIDANPDWGGAAKRLGVEDAQTISLTELVALIDTNTTPAVLQRMMLPTENSVFIVRSDDANVKRLGVERFRELVEHMRRLFSIIVLDTGTAITSDINTACIEIADVVTFPLLTTSGNATKGGPVDGCVHARQQLVADGFADKVAHGITIAMGVEYGQELDAFRLATNNPDGLMLPVPFDGYVGDNQIVRVDPFDRNVTSVFRAEVQRCIAPHTQLAYLDIAIAAFGSAWLHQTPCSNGQDTTRKEDV